MTFCDPTCRPIFPGLPRYKVCFCDLDLVEDCGAGPQSFVVQVGVAYASPLSCLSAEPTFVPAGGEGAGGVAQGNAYTQVPWSKGTAVRPLK